MGDIRIDGSGDVVEQTDCTAFDLREITTLHRVSPHVCHAGERTGWVHACMP